MYKIKQQPEDFKVFEIPNRKLKDSGTYAIFSLMKKNYTTENAIQTIAKALFIPRKLIGYSGSKDSVAITTQFISFKNISPEKVKKLEFKDISLEHVGYSDAPLSLGDLEGNEFIITIRNLDAHNKFNTAGSSHSMIPNYFGEQRFSKNNSEIGKLIITNKFKEASELIKTDNQYGKIVEESLLKSSHDYVNAIRQIPKKILQLYVHAYQSALWNKTVEKYLEKDRTQEKIPMIGFGFETNNSEIQEIVDSILKEEEINERDFIIRQIPELSAEGMDRKLYMDLTNLEISGLEDDELNEGMKKVKVSFKLGKSSYATVAIKYLLI